MKSFLVVFALLGMILLIPAVSIYHNTSINWVIPVIICFSAGLVVTFLTRNFLKKHNILNNFLDQLLFNVMTWGGFAVYIFMASNFYFASDTSKTISVEIMDTGYFTKTKPYCEVVLNNEVKLLRFPRDFKVEEASSVVLTIKKGLWGFEIITDKRLSNKLP